MNGLPADILLEARRLECRIESRVLWANLDIQVHAGDRLAVTGPSGSGKTLLLRTLAGLETLASGRILLGNRPLGDWYMPEYRARVVYMPQKPALREGRVIDIITAPFRMRIRRGTPPPEVEIRQHLLALGRSESLLEQSTEHLSGGELQIVAVLRALAIAPKILLLDEPTASLDAAAAHSVESLVERWLDADPSRACLWTSHDPAQLSRVTHRTLTIGGDR